MNKNTAPTKSTTKNISNSHSRRTPHSQRLYWYFSTCVRGKGNVAYQQQFQPTKIETKTKQKQTDKPNNGKQHEHEHDEQDQHHNDGKTTNEQNQILFMIYFQ
jgi:hypothetical protein